MTDDLVQRLRGDWPEILVEKHWMMDSDAIDKQREEAANRIKQLERDKAAHAATIEGILKAHEAYKQDVSDAVEHCRACSDPEAWTRIKFELERFIIPKPDPLVEDFGHDLAADIRAAIENLGGKIVWGEG